MKKILFLFVMLLGIQSVWAQSSEKTDGNVAFEEAVKALEEKKFIIRFHTMDYRGQKRKQLDSETNFLILEGGSVSYQYDNGRREYRNLDGTTVGYEFPQVKKGKASNVKMNMDERSLSMSVNVKDTKGNPAKFRIKIKLEDKPENCVATMTDYWGNSYYTATLYPIGATTVMKAN